MLQMKEKILKIGLFTVRRCSRLSIKLTLDEARALNAVKMEEMIDKEKIKSLCQNGQKIHGVTDIEYIQITKMKLISIYDLNNCSTVKLWCCPFLPNILMSLHEY